MACMYVPHTLENATWELLLILTLLRASMCGHDIKAQELPVKFAVGRSRRILSVQQVTPK